MPVAFHLTLAKVYEGCMKHGNEFAVKVVSMYQRVLVSSLPCEGGGEDIFAYSTIQMDGYRTLKPDSLSGLMYTEGPKGNHARHRALHRRGVA